MVMCDWMDDGKKIQIRGNISADRILCTLRVNTKDSYNPDFFNGIIEAKKKGYVYVFHAVRTNLFNIITRRYFSAGR